MERGEVHSPHAQQSNRTNPYGFWSCHCAVVQRTPIAYALIHYASVYCVYFAICKKYVQYTCTGYTDNCFNRLQHLQKFKASLAIVMLLLHACTPMPDKGNSYIRRHQWLSWLSNILKRIDANVKSVANVISTATPG